MIKSAIIYSASLPAAGYLQVHMNDRPWREIAPREKVLARFIKDADGSGVHPFPGGYGICLQVDEKILPSIVVKTEINKEINRVEENTGELLSKEEKAEIGYQVEIDLVERALVKTRIVWGFYHIESGFLFVNTATPGYADIFMNELVHVCGSVKTQTINISNINQGLSARLRDVIEGNHERIEPFAFGEYLKIKRKLAKGDPTEVITYSDCSIIEHEVLDQLRHGYQVDMLELALGGFAFRLNAKFHFKRISWPPLDIDSDDADEGEEHASHAWKMEASHKVGSLAYVTQELCTLFDYTPPPLEEEAAEEETS